MRTIDKIIIHCSATPEGRSVTVEEIRRWHVQRGFSDIGYHYVIMADGSVCEGRPLEQAGAHCRGQNAHSIGICYVGGCDQNKRPKDTRTAAQKNAMTELVRRLKRRFPNVAVYGHNEFSNKACPCFDVKQWAKEVCV